MWIYRIHKFLEAPKKYDITYCRLSARYTEKKPNDEWDLWTSEKIETDDDINFVGRARGSRERVTQCVHKKWLDENAT